MIIISLILFVMMFISIWIVYIKELNNNRFNKKIKERLIKEIKETQVCINK